MADPILDEIQRVRQELLKKHGGLHGLFKYVQQLDRARLRRDKKRVSKTRKLGSATSAKRT